MLTVLWNYDNHTLSMGMLHSARALPAWCKVQAESLCVRLYAAAVHAGLDAATDCVRVRRGAATRCVRLSYGPGCWIHGQETS